MHLLRYVKEHRELDIPVRSGRETNTSRSDRDGEDFTDNLRNLISFHFSEIIPDNKSGDREVRWTMLGYNVNSTYDPCTWTPSRSKEENVDTDQSDLSLDSVLVGSIGRGGDTDNGTDEFTDKHSDYTVSPVSQSKCESRDSLAP
jgi:hypothetical protein